MTFTRDIFACHDHDPLLPLLYVRFTSEFKCASGLGFSLDGTKLYVANSCVEEPAWYIYDVNDEGSLSNRRLFLDAKPLRKYHQDDWMDLPDGLAVDDKDNIFATGAGGIVIISPDGSVLGAIYVGAFVANVVIGGDGYLYMAVTDKIKRIKILTKPLKWQK